MKNFNKWEKGDQTELRSKKPPLKLKSSATKKTDT